MFRMENAKYQFIIARAISIKRFGMSSNPQRTIQVIIAFLVIVLIIVTVYSTVEISSLQTQVSDLKNQNDNLQTQLGLVENELSSLSREVSSLAPPPKEATSFYIQVPCLSITPDCIGGSVYAINIWDNGTTSVPQGYSVYLSFKDGTKLTSFAFNTTLPDSLSPGGQVTLTANSWPASTNATTKMSPGDSVGVGLLLASFETAAPAHVLSCTAYTTTFSNYTVTTYVTSVRTCQ